MTALSPALLAAMGAEVERQDLAALEPHVVAAVERGTHRDVALDPARFVAYLGRQLAADGIATAELASALAVVHVGDLYLACACLDGDSRALARFENEHIAHVRSFVARYLSAPAQLDELEQRLRVRLLVGGERGPQLAGYRGRGPLGGWLRVVAVRAAIDLAREASGAHPEPAEPPAIEGDPELGLIKARYAPIFARALESALATLAPRDRTMLRLHFAEGMTLSAIARAFDVYASTVQRTLLRVREQILDSTLGMLGEELGMTPEQAESIVRLVQSRIDLDLRASLATPR